MHNTSHTHSSRQVRGLLFNGIRYGIAAVFIIFVLAPTAHSVSKQVDQLYMTIARTL